MMTDDSLRFAVRGFALKNVVLNLCYQIEIPSNRFPPPAVLHYCTVIGILYSTFFGGLEQGQYSKRSSSTAAHVTALIK